MPKGLSVRALGVYTIGLFIRVYEGGFSSFTWHKIELYKTKNPPIMRQVREHQVFF